MFLHHMSDMVFGSLIVFKLTINWRISFPEKQEVVECAFSRTSENFVNYRWQN